MKGDVFERVLAIVSTVTEVPVEKILSCNRTCEVVDARSIIIYILFEEGMYPSQIACFLKYTASNIRYLISNFHVRVSTRKMLANNLQEIYKELTNH